MTERAVFETKLKYSSADAMKAIRDFENIWKAANKAQIGIKGLAGATMGGLGKDAANAAKGVKNVEKESKRSIKSLEKDSIRSEKAVADRREKESKKWERLTIAFHRERMRKERDVAKAKLNDERRLQNEKKKNDRELERAAKAHARERIREEKRRSKEVSKARAHLSRSLGSAHGKLAGSTGKGLAIAGVGAVALGASSVGNFAAADKGVSEVLTLRGELAGDPRERARIAKLINETSVDFGQGQEATQKALYDTISAGAGEASQQVAAIQTASKLAVGGVTDISVAADGLTSVLNSWGIEFEKADAVADTFFTAMKHGKTTIAQIAHQVGRVGASAAAAGASSEETFAAIATATRGGLKTEQSVSGLKQVFAGIQKPISEAVKEIKRLGLSPEKDFSAKALKEKSLADILKGVFQSKKFNESTVIKLFGSLEAIDVVQNLAKDDFSVFNDGLDLMKDKTGAANEAFAIMAATDHHKFAKLAAEMKVLSIDSGKVLMPLVRDAVKGLKPLIADASGWVEENKELGKELAAVFGKSTKEVVSFVREHKGSIKFMIEWGSKLALANLALAPFIKTLKIGIPLFKAATTALGIGGGAAAAGGAAAGMGLAAKAGGAAALGAGGFIGGFAARSVLDRQSAENELSRGRHNRTRSGLAPLVTGSGDAAEAERIRQTIDRMNIVKDRKSDAEALRDKHKNFADSALNMIGITSASQEVHDERIEALNQAIKNYEIAIFNATANLGGGPNSNGSNKFGVQQSIQVTPKFEVNISTDGQNIQDVSIKKGPSRITKPANAGVIGQ